MNPHPETLNGEPVTVIYLDRSMNPTTPDRASIVKVTHADGRVTIGTRKGK